jgi:hypothetical protein
MSDSRHCPCHDAELSAALKNNQFQKATRFDQSRRTKQWKMLVEKLAEQ